MKHLSSRRAAATGFTLIEVLVALLITGAGLLGIAKIQALTISVTKDTGTRSLIALQVGSLAAAMHANPGYWAQGAAPAQILISGTTISDPVLDAGIPGGCLAFCSPAQLAAVDMKNWANDMNNQFPSYTGKIDCTMVIPIHCSIHVDWTEKIVAINKAATAGSQVNTESFSIYVKP